MLKPVWSAWCTTRRLPWPPSRVRCKLPSSSKLKGTPSCCNHAIASLPASSIAATCAASQRPSPAIKVSWMCSATLSSAAITAAMPPWARLLAQVSKSCLANMMMRVCVGKDSATLKPAKPAPMIKTSQECCCAFMVAYPVVKVLYVGVQIVAGSPKFAVSGGEVEHVLYRLACGL